MRAPVITSSIIAEPPEPAYVADDERFTLEYVAELGNAYADYVPTKGRNKGKIYHAYRAPIDDIPKILETRAYREMPSKYYGNCEFCGRAITRGAPIVYLFEHKIALHADCFADMVIINDRAHRAEIFAYVVAERRAIAEKITPERVVIGAGPFHMRHGEMICPHDHKTARTAGACRFGLTS